MLLVRYILANAIIVCSNKNSANFETANGYNTSLRSISASGHKVPQESLRRFGSALSTQAGKLKDDENGVSHVAIGSRDMGDVGIIAFCEGLEESDGGLIQSLDLAWKEM